MNVRYVLMNKLNTLEAPHNKRTENENFNLSETMYSTIYDF